MKDLRDIVDHLGRLLEARRRRLQLREPNESKGENDGFPIAFAVDSKQ